MRVNNKQKKTKKKKKPMTKIQLYVMLELLNMTIEPSNVSKIK